MHDPNQRRTRRSKTTRAAVGLAVTVGLVAALVGTAQADYAPSGTDVVGVGGETPQYNLDFAADGDIVGDLGYNAANNVNKLISIDATGDSNGRASYANGSTAASPKVLNPTVVLRAGSSPIPRPATTGAGYSALLADTGSPAQINFIRAANLPTAANQQAAANNGWGYLHVVQIGTDPLEIVGSTSSNAPAGLSVQQLLGIYTGVYTKWNQLPGNAAGSGNTIIPLLPPNGSSISKLLLADLKTANGGTTPVLSSSVLTVEQNDPGAITTASSPNDAIVPFSLGRLNLWNSGYFRNPATPFPGGAVLTPGVKTLAGTTTDTNAAYTNINGLYVVFRQSDASSSTPFQPGSTKNWIQALFSDPAGSPFFKRASGQALVAAAGAIPGYNDLGNVSAG
jgi:ABC-type phosphate transport system substrate-binding protein